MSTGSVFVNAAGHVVGYAAGTVWAESSGSGPGYEFDYYISPTGSNSNPGTLSEPWSLTALQDLGSTYAGKIIGIIGDQGTYEVLTLCGPYQSGGGSLQFTPLISIAGGTASSPTVVASCNSSGQYVSGFVTQGSPSSGWKGATLDGQGTSSNNASAQPVIGTYGTGGAYVTIDGLQIINAYYQAINVGWGSGADFTDAIAGQVVQNCYINTVTDDTSEENAAFIQLEGTSGALVQNNYLTGLTSNDNRGCGIICWTTGTAIVQYNTIISTNVGLNAGIDFKADCQGNNVVRWNYIDLSSAATGPNAVGCLNFDNGVGSGTTDTAYGNIFIGPCLVYPYSIVEGGYPSATNAQAFYNNTFIMVPTSNDEWGWTRYGADQTITYYNNIFAHASGSGFGDGDFFTNQSALALSDYNCWAASSPKWGMTDNGSSYYTDFGPYTSLSAWQSGLATENPSCVGADAHSIAESPDFTDSGALATLYQLASGSPCKGTGSTTGTTGGSACDMGAWGGASPPTRIGCNL